MIIDSSAVLAVLQDEPEGPKCAETIERADVCRISAANFLESAIVIDRSGNPLASRYFDQFLDDVGMVVETVTVEQAQLARAAYRDFGKGSGHPAQLNYGDCFAYALAKTTGEPLLFIGNDFSHTDVQPAI